MKYTKKEFGLKLKSHILANKDFNEISDWAHDVYLDYGMSFEQNFQYDVLKLVAMQEGPEFILSNEQLLSLADKLINENTEDSLNQINDFDRKILETIKIYLDEYENNKIELGFLVGKLEGLFRQLTSTEKKWSIVFFDNWINLESVYAGSLEPERSLNENEQNIVNKSVQLMISMIQKLLENYTKYPNNTVTKTAEALDNDWLFCLNCLDGWESNSTDPLVICPKCNNVFLNPRYSK